MRNLLPYLPIFGLALGVFAWQFAVGLVIGREAGFLVYAVIGLLPLMIAGAPWFTLLCPEGDLDLTEFSALMVSYHAAALVSLLLNALLISLLLEGVRQLVRRRRPPDDGAVG